VKSESASAITTDMGAGLHRVNSSRAFSIGLVPVARSRQVYIELVVEALLVPYRTQI
jgi:hypothetical protein